ncbi:MAG: c-type cytochrome [Vicinamibacterales bacterium]
MAGTFGAIVCLWAGGQVLVGQRQMPPAWPYGQPQLAPGVVPPQAPPQRTPAATPAAAPNPNAPPPVLRQAEGSKFQFAQQQIGDNYGPADWFPEDHPPMPDIVAHGRPGVVRACGLCHLPTGRGRPENAPVQGLPHDYIVQQLRDFKQGVRHSADPRKANTGEMENIAKALTEQEIEQVATYFSSIKVPKYVRVVETDAVPTMRIMGEIYFPTDDGQKEPIGVRIIETPENVAQTQLRNPRSGFIAYAPVGSVKRGEALATSGGNGKTIACSTCHGPELKGVGPIPTLAGRSPSYLARQMYDIKLGTRNGAMAALMKPVVTNLTDSDIVDLIAYVSSLTP